MIQASKTVKRCLSHLQANNKQHNLKYWNTVELWKIFIPEKDSRSLISIEIDKKMKIWTVAFMLLFNYLDTLPKL